MSKLWEKTGSAKDNSDLKEVDLSTLNISGRTVIYLPGREQTDNNPTELSKGIHFVNKLCADIPDPPKVYIWSHSNMYSQKGIKDLTSLFHVAAYSHIPNLRFPAARKLARNLIMPLVTDADGKPLPLEQAQKNLRNVTLLGYCFGSVTAQEVYHASVKMMKKSGYAEEDARKLLRDELVLITFATFTRPKKEADHYTTVNFINNDDLFIGIKNVVVLPLTSLVKLGKVFSAARRKLLIEPLSESSVLVSATAREPALDSMLGDEPQEVIDGVTLPPGTLKASNHEAKDYVNDNDGTNQLAGMVKFAVINAVCREGPVNPVDLLNEPSIQQRTPEEKSQYEQKIDQGLMRATGVPKWKKFFGFR